MTTRLVQNRHLVAGLGAGLMIPSIAVGWHFDYRFVERVGFTDFPIAPGSVYNAAPGAPLRLRIQFGVFDDAVSAAPAGGLVGWVVGTISASGGGANSTNTRTPGRLPPFTFAGGVNSNGNPPMPAGEPFQFLTDIDATLGTQSPLWLNDPLGNPLPVPQPQIRGINAFVSVYEITTTPALGGSNYTITAGGNLIAASGWGVVGGPVPPDNNNTPLDPSDDVPGSVTYAPFPLPPQSFLLPPLVLDIQVPAPGAGVVVAIMAGAGGALVRGRRRVVSQQR